MLENTQILGIVLPALVASVLSWMGIVFSAYINNKQLNTQLDHNINEKSKARRAEVYLKAAEELVKANMYLTSLPQINLAKINAASGLQEFYAVAAKLKLIGEQKTSLLTGELIGDYNGLFFKLMKDVLPINSIQTQIDNCTFHYNKAQEQINRILSEMRQMNEAGRIENEVFNAQRRSLDFQEEQSKKLSDEIKLHDKEKQRLLVTFYKSLISELSPIEKKSNELMIELRKELGIDGDIDTFSQQLTNQTAKEKVRVIAFIKQIESKEK